MFVVVSRPAREKGSQSGTCGFCKFTEHFLGAVALKMLLVANSLVEQFEKRLSEYEAFCAPNRAGPQVMQLGDEFRAAPSGRSRAS